MSKFTVTPNQFRAIFVLLATLMLIIAGINLYHYASSPTDENVFRTAPSDLYITKNIPASPLRNNQGAGGDDANLPRDDTVRVGDLILSINERVVTHPEKVRYYLDKVAAAERFELVVFRPAIARELAFEVPRAAFSDSSFREIPSSVVVVQVTEGGASDRAGLQVGDLIIRINGEHFKDQSDAQRILRLAKSGNALAYEIIRGNRELTLTITLARVGIRLTALMMVLGGLLFWGVAFIVALRRPEFTAARLIGLSFLSLGFFLIAFYPAISNHNLTGEFFYFASNAMLILSLMYSLPLWLHMEHYFPIERDELLKRKWIRVGAYLLATLFLGLLLLSRNFLFVALGVPGLLMYGRAVPWFFRKERSAESRQLSRMICRTGRFINIVFGLAFVGFFIFESRGGPHVTGPPQTGPFIEFFRGFFAIPLALVPLSYLFTIGHYRLLNMDLRIRRNIQYNAITVAWGIGMLAALFFVLFKLPTISLDLPNVKFEGSFIEVVEQPLSAAERLLAEKLVISFLAIGLFVISWRIRRAGQQLIDKKFDRAEFDYRKAASELAEVMGAQFTMEGLAEGIVARLTALMQVKRVGVLFFRNEENCCCADAYGMPENEWRSFCSEMNPRIIQVLQTNRSDYRFSVEYLPEDIQAVFEEYGFRHIIAIRSKERLVGTLLIGEKRSESPFHKDDLIFLGTVAKQAAVAIENAFLYEKLSEQERLRHELNIARRIQLASLPQHTPTVPGLDIAGISIPAQEVGGDYYDYLIKNQAKDITIIIGDVSGKGTSAALYMSKLQGIMRSLHAFGLSPRELLIRANQLLMGDLERKSFVTAMSVAFDVTTRRLRLARAGHLPLYHFCARTGEVTLHTPRGIGLALTNSRQFSRSIEEMQIEYEPGDVFLFITDGITEAHNTRHEEFGDLQLMKLLRNTNGGPARHIRDQVVTTVNKFVGNIPPHDDLTVVVVKVVENPAALLTSQSANVPHDRTAG